MDKCNRKLKILYKCIKEKKQETGKKKERWREEEVEGGGGVYREREGEKNRK